MIRVMIFFSKRRRKRGVRFRIGFGARLRFERREDFVPSGLRIDSRLGGDRNDGLFGDIGLFGLARVDRHHRFGAAHVGSEHQDEPGV